MSSLPLFRDRQEAGKRLAEAVLAAKEDAIALGTWTEPIVYALPKGGLPVAEVVAQVLGCPLDVVVAKKITEPQSPEFAIGAITADGAVVYPRQQFWSRMNRGRWQEALTKAYQKALDQAAQFAPMRPQVNATDKIAVVVDDGIATGMTMAAAVQSLQPQQPAQIWICIPVAPPQLMNQLQEWSDRVLVLATPESFQSVSRFYEQFPQVTLQEAQDSLLHQSHRLAIGHH